MKKILIASLAALGAMGASFSAVAAPVAVALTADTFVDAGAAVNTAQVLAIAAVADRAGFVKNDFEVTLSANVKAGMLDNTNRFGVVAGNNRGRNVFTGSSLGGSVSACGAQVDGKTTFGDSLAVTATLNLDNPNGCGRE